MTATLHFITSTDVGVVTNLFSQDMTLVDGLLPISLVNLAMEGFAALGMAAVIATASTYLLIAYPFLLVVIYGIASFYLRTSRQMRLLDLEAKSPLYTHFIDTIKHLATVRAFGWVQHCTEQNTQFLDTSQRPGYLLAMIQQWLAFTIQAVVGMLAIIVVVLTTQLPWTSKAFTGASLVALMSLGDSLRLIVRMSTELETSIGAIGRLKKFGDEVEREDRRREGKGDVVALPPDWPLRGAIVLDGVSASYENTSSRDEPRECKEGHANEVTIQQLVLKDLHLSIASGEKVAICGRTGSGKSSLIHLLVGILDPVPSSADKALIDDIPIHKMDRAILRQRIITLPQEPVFLPDGSSFLSNLDPLGASTEDECRQVLEAVQLASLIEHLHADMSADSLSRGQKQLFSLARAILRRRIRSRELGAAATTKTKGGILLIDEFTSGVDKETEKTMLQLMEREFGGYTIILVTHRLDVVMDFDTVVIMHQGGIVETGRPRDLARADGSRFQELCDAS